MILLLSVKIEIVPYILVVQFPSGAIIGTVLVAIASRPALGSTQPSIQWGPETFTLGVERPGREADHSPPYSAEVKNTWSCTSTPQYVFMSLQLFKHRDSFTFYLTLIHIVVNILCAIFQNLTLLQSMDKENTC
jgi:hypothetical protein